MDQNGLAFYLGPVLPPRADGSPLENTSANVNRFLPKLSKELFTELLLEEKINRPESLTRNFLDFCLE